MTLIFAPNTCSRSKRGLMCLSWAAEPAGYLGDIRVPAEKGGDAAETACLKNVMSDRPVSMGSGPISKRLGTISMGFSTFCIGF